MTVRHYVATLKFGSPANPTFSTDFAFTSTAVKTGTVSAHGRAKAEKALGTDQFLVTDVRPDNDARVTVTFRGKSSTFALDGSELSRGSLGSPYLSNASRDFIAEQAEKSLITVTGV